MYESLPTGQALLCVASVFGLKITLFTNRVNVHDVKGVHSTLALLHTQAFPHFNVLTNYIYCYYVIVLLFVYICKEKIDKNERG